MGRLIDADALLEQVQRRTLVDSIAAEIVRDCVDITRRIIKEQPTVDAVPVVRCRECKYWGDEDDKLPRSDGVLFARCKVHNYLIDGRHTGWCPTENDFCSYGERKEGAD